MASGVGGKRRLGEAGPGGGKGAKGCAGLGRPGATLEGGAKLHRECEPVQKSLNFGYENEC